MTAKNDITGDKLQTKVASKEYRDGYENIYGIPLYKVPNQTWVESVEDGHRFFFDHPDGMYSFCYEVGGGISHYNLAMKVRISENQNDD